MPEPYFSYAKMRYDAGIYTETQLDILIGKGKLTEEEKMTIMGGE